MAEIRSVSVHLDADVAGYIAKMRLAGAETDKAFGRSTRGIDSTNSSLGRTEATLGGVESQARKAESAVTRLDNSFRRTGSNGGAIGSISKKLDGFTRGLGLIPVLAVPAASALIPVTAAVGALGAGLVAPLAVAGGGLTVFGLLAGAAVHSTQEQEKAIAKLQATLDGTKKGTKEYGAALKQLHDAQAALSPGQKAFEDSLGRIKADFQDFIQGQAGTDLLAPLTGGLKVADHLLPTVQPLIHSVSGSLSDLMDQFDRYTQSRGFQAMSDDFAHLAGRDIGLFGKAFGSVADGLGHLLLLLDHKLGGDVLHGLDNLTANFDRWSQSKGARKDVEDFVGYIHKVGPGVGDTVGSIARGFGRLVTALAPLGPPTLRVIKGIADAVSAIPTPVLTALLGGAAGGAAFGKVGGFKVLPGALRVGQNVLSSVTGGLVPGTSKYGRGVQAVYVTNPGFGGGSGGPGGGGGPTGVVGKVGGFLEKHPVIGVGLGVTGLAAVVAGTAYGLYKIARAEDSKVTDTQHPNGSNQTIYQARQQRQLELHNMYPDQVAAVTDRNLKATQRRVDDLTSHLGKASQGMELVGHSADRAFPNASRQVQDTAAKLERINGAKASQAMDVVGHSASANFARAGGSVDNFKGKLNSIPGNKTVDVNANTGDSLSRLRAVAAELANIRSKTVTLTTKTVTGGHVKMGNADGGTIGGPRYPYGDKVLSMLAPGEEVISNRYGQADRYRADVRSGRIPGYASGGTVGGSGGAGGNGPDGSALHRFQVALQDATKALDVERQHRQTLIQTEQQMAQAVRDTFRSQLFGGGTAGVWGSASDPESILRTDIRNARRFNHLDRRLAHRGASAGLLSQVTTLEDAQALSGDSRAELRRLSRLYAIRQRASRAAGATAGDLVVGDRIAESNKHLKALRGDVHRLTAQVKHLEHEQAKHAKSTGHAVGQAINQGVRNGARRATK